MGNEPWNGSVPQARPAGSAADWYPSLSDPYVLFYWDGSAWTAARRVGSSEVYAIDPVAGPPLSPPEHRARRATTPVVVVVVVALIAAIAVGLTLASRGASAQPSQPGILQASEAEAVYSALIPRIDRDMSSPLGFVSDLRAVVSAPALEVLIAEAACGCLQLPRLPAVSTEFSVPVERRYPLTFLAETDETLYQPSDGKHFNYTFVDVFERRSPSTGWRLNDYFAATKIHLMTPGVVLLGSPGRPKGPGATWTLAQLVRAMVGARYQGRVPDGNFWESRPTASAIADLINQLVSYHRADHSGVDTGGFALSDASPIFRTSLGPFVCGNITGSNRYSQGTDVLQPSNRRVFGTLLAPGLYSSVSSASTRVACLLYPTQLSVPILYWSWGGVWRMWGSAAVGA